jgi:hypothetical protein
MEQQQPVIIVIKEQGASSRVKIQDVYKAKAAGILGIIQVLCGLVAFITEILGITHFGGGCMAGTGIWVSVFFFISGGLAIGSAKSSNSCLIVGTLVMSIFSAITAFLMILFGSLNWTFNHCNYYRNTDITGNHIYPFQILAGLVVLVLAISSSALSCQATCCRPKRKSSDQQVVFSPTDNNTTVELGNLAARVVRESTEQTTAPPDYQTVIDENQEDNSFKYQKL